MKITCREVALGCTLLVAALTGCNHGDEPADNPSAPTSTQVVVQPDATKTAQTSGVDVVKGQPGTAETTTTKTNLTVHSTTGQAAATSGNAAAGTTSGPTKGPKSTSHLPGWPTTATSHSLPGGLQYKDLKVGTGAAAKAGDTISMQYTGYLTNGTKFDSSLDHPGQPFSFTLGVHQVIQGWDEGIVGMKVGGKRKLIIPSALAYGAAGTPGGSIPANADLVFDTELVQIAGSGGPAPAGGSADVPIGSPSP